MRESSRIKHLISQTQEATQALRSLIETNATDVNFQLLPQEQIEHFKSLVARFETLTQTHDTQALTALLGETDHAIAAAGELIRQSIARLLPHFSE